MTSPELPFVYGGMIWDGVTEYQNVLPPEQMGRSLWLCRMYGDGTRRFSESAGTDTPMGHMQWRTSQGWEVIGIALEQPYYHLNTGFLQHDGTISNEWPDQGFPLLNYRAHASRFAHQLDAVKGYHSLDEVSEEDRLTVINTLSALIGSAWRRYDEWAVIDPAELIVGGNYDGTLLWKRDMAEYAAIDVALCGQCDAVTFGRRFLFHADLPAFRRLWRQGIVYAVDRTTDPWSPTLFDAASGDVGDFYNELKADYRKALDYYDETSGAQDHA